jgi:hypothetical protein
MTLFKLKVGDLYATGGSGGCLCEDADDAKIWTRPGHVKSHISLVRTTHNRNRQYAIRFHSKDLDPHEYDTSQLTLVACELTEVSEEKL